MLIFSKTFIFAIPTAQFKSWLSNRMKPRMNMIGPIRPLKVISGPPPARNIWDEEKSSRARKCFYLVESK